MKTRTSQATGDGSAEHPLFFFKFQFIGILIFMRIRGLFLEDFRETPDNKNTKNKRLRKKHELTDIKKEKVKKNSQKLY